MYLSIEVKYWKINVLKYLPYVQEKYLSTAQLCRQLITLVYQMKVQNFVQNNIVPKTFAIENFLISHSSFAGMVG